MYHYIENFKHGDYIVQFRKLSFVKHNLCLGWFVGFASNYFPEIPRCTIVTTESPEIELSKFSAAELMHIFCTTYIKNPLRLFYVTQSFT